MNYQELLDNTRQFVEAAIPALKVIAFTTGIVLITRAGVTLVNQHDGRQRGEENMGKKVLATMAVAGFLLQLSTSMDWAVNLVFGKSAESVNSYIAYSPGGAKSDFWTNVIQVCMLWVTLMGWVGAFRGYLAWSAAAGGGSSGASTGDLFWKGFWHIIGGACAVNVAVAAKYFLSS